MTDQELQNLHNRMVWAAGVWFQGASVPKIDALNAMRYVLAGMPELDYSWEYLSHLINLQLNQVSIEGYCD
jgi:hypothetical protein